MENIPIISTAKTQNSQQYITFKIGEELYGIGIMSVKEAMPPDL
jgi:chemotaxis signal transduction protein